MNKDSIKLKVNKKIENTIKKTKVVKEKSIVKPKLVDKANTLSQGSLM